jgi:hypothetical protein
MTDRLTDAEVAAIRNLIRIDAIEVYNNVSAKDLDSVLAEVQSTRQRRCGNCKEWQKTEPTMCAWLDQRTGAEWFCADFEAKP